MNEDNYVLPIVVKHTKILNTDKLTCGQKCQYYATEMIENMCQTINSFKDR